MSFRVISELLSLNTRPLNEAGDPLEELQVELHYKKYKKENPEEDTYAFDAQLEHTENVGKRIRATFEDEVIEGEVVDEDPYSECFLVLVDESFREDGRHYFLVDFNFWTYELKEKSKD